MAERRVWVLDTATKGTGAEMVPLDRVLERPKPAEEPPYVPPKREPHPPAAPAPREPRRFRVIDVMTRAVLADDADARATVEVLGGVRSTFDVSLYVWEPAGERWRLLTLGEQRELFKRRVTPP